MYILSMTCTKTCLYSNMVLVSTLKGCYYTHTLGRATLTGCYYTQESAPPSGAAPSRVMCGSFRRFVDLLT